MVKLFCKILSNKEFAIIFALISMVLVSIFQIQLAQTLGARQSYSSGQASFLSNGIGGGFVFWTIIMGLIFYSKLKNVSMLPHAFILFYITLYIFNPLAGRFLLILIPFIHIGLSESKNYVYYALITLIFNAITLPGVLDQML